MTSSFTTFALDYVAKHKDLQDTFEVPPALLDEFRVFLSERNIRPGVSEWSGDRDHIVNRLKTEIFNQAFGIAKGDEVEAQRDPQIQRAVQALQPVK
ncbi:MAG: hypothetical protein ABIZ80_06905 [Bryobacteraceae bacterium]